MRSITYTPAPAQVDDLTPSLTVAALAERLEHPFDEPALLDQALSHRSWCAENPGHESNERLEFLGDAVLGLIVAEHVFASYPESDEGWLSRARSTVVRASALAEMASQLGIGESLRLGKGEDATGGREKTSILADAMEAVIGAVYLDGGWPAAAELVLRMVTARIADLPGIRGDLDHKSTLQELASRDALGRPVYEVQEHGPEHHKTFDVTVLLSGRRWGSGSGPSKKAAEQSAARATLTQLLSVLAATPPLTNPKDSQDA